jgi:hypothetical protein
MQQVIQQIIDLVKAGKKPIVLIKSISEANEEFIELHAGQVARVTEIGKEDWDGEYWYTFTLDALEFLELNKPKFEPVWYLSGGGRGFLWQLDPSGWEKKISKVRFTINPEEDTLALHEPSPLQQRYLEEGKGMAYVEWLEQELGRLGDCSG